MAGAGGGAGGTVEGDLHGEVMMARPWIEQKDEKFSKIVQSAVMTNSPAEIILASGSPRRRDLLAEAGIAFVVEVPGVEEWDQTTHPELGAVEIAMRNAERKAQEVSRRFPDRVVLAADTVVLCQGRLLGKPGSVEEARTMLGWLQGKTHEVVTAVVWLRRDEKTVREAVSRTRVTFRPLDEEAITAYLERVDVMDKAGAYALQECGEMIVERVEGSRTNVIGLPMEIVAAWAGRSAGGVHEPAG
jgi:septum formation protein